MPKFLILILLLISTNVHANSIEDCVKLIENKYQITNALSSEFIQTTYVTLTKQTVKKKGLFYFEKKDKFKIEYLPPNQRVYSSDGLKLYVYSGDKSDLIIEPLNDDTIPLAAYTFLKGFQNLSKQFKITISSAFKEENNDICKLNLVPKKKTTFDSLDVLFTKDGLLNEVIINNKSGNTSHYNFSKTAIINDLEDTLFIP